MNALKQDKTHTLMLSKRTEPRGLESQNTQARTHTHGWMKALDTFSNQAIKWPKDMNGIMVKPPPKLGWLIHTWIIKAMRPNSRRHNRFCLTKQTDLWEFCETSKTLHCIHLIWFTNDGDGPMVHYHESQGMPRGPRKRPNVKEKERNMNCLLYTSPSPRD